MSESDSWDSSYKSREFEHWEPIYPSPELAVLAAAGTFGEGKIRILDVGCGGGLDAIFLAKCGFDIVGVDISRTALRIAKRRATKARVTVDWRLGDVLDLPLEDESVDYVTDRGLFHLLEDHDRPRYSSELYRVLKQNGGVLIRGASEEVSEGRFNPVSEIAIKRYFASKSKTGPVLPIPLFSKEGSLSGRIVYLRKREIRSR